MKRFLSSCARLSRFAISISLGLTALATLGHTAAHAGTIYSLSNSLSGTSVQNGWTISGSIELQDSTSFGAITSSSIKNWNWTASKPGSSSVSASSAAGFVNLFTFPSGGVTATATGLYFQAPQQNLWVQTACSHGLCPEVVKVCTSLSVPICRCVCRIASVVLAGSEPAAASLKRLTT